MNIPESGRICLFIPIAGLLFLFSATLFAATDSRPEGIPAETADKPGPQFSIIPGYMSAGSALHINDYAAGLPETIGLSSSGGQPSLIIRRPLHRLFGLGGYSIGYYLEYGMTSFTMTQGEVWDSLNSGYFDPGTSISGWQAHLSPILAISTIHDPYRPERRSGPTMGVGYGINHLSLQGNFTVDRGGGQAPTTESHSMNDLIDSGVIFLEWAFGDALLGIMVRNIDYRDERFRYSVSFSKFYLGYRFDLGLK